jgi:type I restriction enzyme S subunit
MTSLDSQLRHRTPRARFPAFRDSPGWRATPLSAVLCAHGQKSDGLSEVHSVSVHKGVVNQVEHLGRSFAAADRAHYNLAKPHDIIYTRSPTGEFPFGVVKENRNPYNVVVSPLYGVFSPQNKDVAFLLDAYFESPTRTSNYLASITQKGAKNTLQISNDTFLSKELYLPSLEGEQNKVAECLRSLVAVIASQALAVEQCHAYKTGLVQQLLPRSGESTPRLRFQAFRNAPAWRSERLGGIATFVKGKGIAKADLDPGGELPCIRYGELYTRYGEVIDTVYSRTSVPVSELILSRANDVIIPASGETKLDIAKAACVLHGGIALGSDLNVIRTAHNGTFLSYCLNGPKRLDIARVAQGDTVVHLYPSQLEQLDIMLPEEPEQILIAACLSSADSILACQIGRLEVLKEFKRGLIQRLFPSAETTEP